jgi:cytoskeleton protein RodZ
MSSPAGGEVRVGIGARLRAGRERAGLTLLQAAERLHVDSKVLEALEAEQFESLGAPVFARGHMRRYADLIGENAEQLRGMYTQSVPPPPPPDMTYVLKVRRPGDSRKLVAPGIVGLFVIAIAGGVWIVMQLGRDGPEQAIETTELIVPPSEAPGSAIPIAPEPKPAPIAAATPPKTVAPATAAAPKPRTVEVKLKFAADSWVEIYDVNGERLFYDIGSAPSERSVTGTPPLRVVLGNAAGVALEVNGRERRVPARLVQDEGAQFTINRGGRIAK